MIRKIKDFYKHIKMYFTHYNIISIGKKMEGYDINEWYKCTYSFKYTGTGVTIGNVLISKEE